MFDVKVDIPDLGKNEVQIPCPVCKKKFKVRLKDLEEKKVRECPMCKTPIEWKK